MEPCFIRRPHKKLAVMSFVIVIALLVACTSGCSSNSPDSKALAFVKAIYEEHDPQKATNMACTAGTIGWLDVNRIVSESESSKKVEVTQFTVLQSINQPASASDKANGITGNAQVLLQFAYRKTGETSWSDGTATVFLESINNVWCVTMFFGYIPIW